MINVAIQLLTLLAGLLVNFVIPALYGLEAYGAFIQANILVFVFQKLTDIVNEPLISQVEAAQVFPLALVMAVSIWLPFALLDAVFHLGSPVLLAAMLLSSCVLLGLYAQRRYRILLIYLLGFILVFFLLLGLKEWGYWPLSIVEVLIWTNLAAVLPAAYIVVTPARWTGAGAMVGRVLRAAPGNVSATLVFNLFTNLLPYLLSKTLPLAELGLFRVMTSVVQSATSLFPFNTKALFVLFRRDAEAARLYPALLGVALAWFAGLATGALLLAVFEPRLQPFLALVGSLSVLYWAVLSERYLLATHRKRMVILANLVVGCLATMLALRIDTIGEAVLLYAISFAMYAAWTLALAGRGAVRIFALAIALSTPLAVYVQNTNLESAVLWQGGLTAIAFILFGTRFADLRRLGVRL